MKPFLVALAVSLVTFWGDPSLSQAQRTTSKEAAKQAVKPGAAKAKLDKDDVEPEASDEIAEARVWTDTTGEHSITAALQSVKADNVMLKKENGTTVAVPINKLNKENQELVRAFLALSSKRKVLNAIESFFDTDFGDTDARIAVNEKAAARKLCNQINGRPIRLVFVIKNVQPRDKGLYRLDLCPPDFPGSGWNYSSLMNQRLNKEDSLRIGPTSVLVVDGRVHVEFSNNGEFTIADYYLSWSRAAKLPSGNSNVNREVRLGLDNVRMKVRKPSEENRAKQAWDKGDRSLQQDDLKSALSAYSEAIQLNPKDPKGYFRRAAAYPPTKKHLEQKIADYTRAIQLDAKFVAAYHNRGNSYVEQRDYVKAIADYSAVDPARWTVFG
jgi:hypothetical protein